MQTIFFWEPPFMETPICTCSMSYQIWNPWQNISANEFNALHTACSQQATRPTASLASLRSDKIMRIHCAIIKKSRLWVKGNFWTRILHWAYQIPWKVKDAKGPAQSCTIDHLSAAHGTVWVLSSGRCGPIGWRTYAQHTGLTLVFPITVVFSSHFFLRVQVSRVDTHLYPKFAIFPSIHPSIPRSIHPSTLW